MILLLLPVPLFNGHYTGQAALAGTPDFELEDFVGAKFYCLHALAGTGREHQGIPVSHG